MKKISTPSVGWLFVVALSLSVSAFAQKPMPNDNAVQIALNFLKQKQTAWQLAPSDVEAPVVQDFYTTEHNGVTHVYLLQQHAGIELHNAIVNVNVLPSGEVLYAGNRFMTNLAAATNATQPTITPDAAVRFASEQLGLKVYWEGKIVKQISKYEFQYEKGAFLSDVNVKLRYQKVDKGVARLAWDLNIDQPDGHDHWSIRVDALTGKILEKISYTTHCTVHKDAYAHQHDATCIESTQVATPLSMEEEVPAYLDITDGRASYKVFPFPAESPIHGAHTLVANPADSVASPFGWHDVNGVVGAEYQITRGNNAHAYLDLLNTNTSSNNEPNGGTNLVFNEPYLATGEPDTNRNAAVVNLFYANNMIHDIAQRYGFTEASGNFQMRNYSGLGAGNDYVVAQAQDGANLPTPNTNNANMATPPDGSAPRMQMYVWTNAGAQRLIQVVAPQPLVGGIECTSPADWGRAISTTPVTGDVVIANDRSGTPTMGCTHIANNTDYTGKIVLIDRGTCEFGAKAWNAQRRGAIAAIICNFEDALIGMAAGANGASVTIPVAFIKNSDCQRIRVAAGANGLRLTLVAPTSTGPARLDGDFDNGIIAHEYTHGISNRLTGGRLNTSCLNNAEQGGEGWSDFFTLITGVRPGDNATTNRGVGTFVQREATNGTGIRRYPYNTNMSVNPLTYGNIVTNGAVHDIGEVWSVALWDLYWKFVDRYGWSANLRDTASGNGRMIKLVMDGMKIQPCTPGFLDARDAILAADRANFGGMHECMIWDVFARRGMGYFANQGLSTSTTDNIESLAGNPFCVKAIKMEKTVTSNVVAGQEVTVSIKVYNHKGVTATNVVITDPIPQFCTYVAGSASNGGALSGSSARFVIPTMRHNDTVILTYRFRTDANRRSISFFNDGFENIITSNNWWTLESLKNGNIWDFTDLYANTGTNSIGVAYPTTGSSEQAVKTSFSIPVSGTQPVLRFYHRYDTEAGFDGGFVQISTNNGSTWQTIEDKIFRGNYNGVINYQTFVLPNLQAFSGTTNNQFIQTNVDLSSYRGQNINVRFRFGTDSLENRIGWFVDDVMVMDLINYNSTASLTSNEGDTATAVAPFRGTHIEPQLRVNSQDLNEELVVKVFPNPAGDYINVNIAGNTEGETKVSVMSIDGRVMMHSKVDVSNSKDAVLPFNLTNLPAGMYFVKVETGEKTIVEKVVKQ